MRVADSNELRWWVGGFGTLVLIVTLTSPSYFVLALSHKDNSIGPDGAAAVAEALHGMPNIQHLYLGGMLRGMIPNHHTNTPPSHTRKWSVDTID